MRSQHAVLPGLLAAGLLLALVWSGTSRAADAARIEDVRVELDGPRVLLSFRLADAFDEELQRRIESGLPSGYVFDLRLTRARKRWFDKDLESGQLQVAAMYNAVTGEYLINYKHNGDLVESRVVRDPSEVRSAMTEFEDLPAFSLERVRSERRFRVRIRAELGTKTLLFFIPTTRTTDWVDSSKFRYPPARRPE